MEGWLYSWRVGWNDCGWKMINQKLPCQPARSQSLARHLSVRLLGQASYVASVSVHRASFNATRSDILAPSLSSPLLPPDIVPLLFRPPPVPLLFVCRRRRHFLPFKGTVLSQFTYLLQLFIESTFNRFVRGPSIGSTD